MAKWEDKNALTGFLQAGCSLSRVLRSTRRDFVVAWSKGVKKDTYFSTHMTIVEATGLDPSHKGCPQPSSTDHPAPHWLLREATESGPLGHHVPLVPRKPSSATDFFTFLILHTKSLISGWRIQLQIYYNWFVCAYLSNQTEPKSTKWAAGARNWMLLWLPGFITLLNETQSHSHEKHCENKCYRIINSSSSSQSCSNIFTDIEALRVGLTPQI